MIERTLQATQRIQQVEFRAMGSQILAAVDSGHPDVGKVLAEVPRWFEGWEQTLSRFRPDSELCRLNRTAGSSTRVPVSDTLWSVLGLALEAAHYTDGLVTPTVLDALEAAGYTGSFDEMARNAPSGGTEVRGQAVMPTSLREIKTYPNTRSVRLPEGVRLDFGGIAKGWAADQAMERLSTYGPALVNAGGDIAVSGPMRDGNGWLIGVDAPSVSVPKGNPTPTGARAPGRGPRTFAPDSRIEMLSIMSGGVATSGRDYRRWQQGNEWRHHIIDPRTGLPADTDVIAATIVAPTTSEAEVAAKVALLLGSERGLQWLEARPSLAGLLVLDGGQVVCSWRLREYLWSIRYGN